MSSISNIATLCRTCMQNSTKLKSIWDSLEESIIASVVTNCTGVEIVEDNDLPNKICQKCLKELSNYVQFIKKTRESDRQLRQIFKIKKECEVDNTKIDSDLTADGFLEIEMNTSIKDESERDIQSDFEHDSQDYDDDINMKIPSKSDAKRASRTPTPDYDKLKEDIMELEAKPVPTAKKVGRKLKFKSSKGSDCVDESQAQDDEGSLKTPSKSSSQKVVREPDELEQKTFETVQINKGVLLCCSCFQEFANSSDLEEHVKTAHAKNQSTSSSEEKNVCETCFRGYASKQALITHKVRTQQMTSVFECKICKFRCVFPSRRMAHAKAHDRPDRLKEAYGFLCCAKMCNKSFATEELLLQHAPVAHKADKIQAEIAFCNKTRPFQCSICYACFPSEKHVEGHRYRKYQPKRHQCSTCGESFYKKLMLELHEGTHMNEKNIVCEICSKRFPTKVELQRHLSYHAAKPRFVCDHCGKVFNKSSRLQGHVLAHEGKLPYVCEVCNKAFLYKIRLVYHMRTHTGKPFPCRFCDTRFTQKSRARIHEKKKHLKEIIAQNILDEGR